MKIGAAAGGSRASARISADLYRLAEEHGVQIRRLNYRRDSLEDIFLKAMENSNGRP